MGDGDDSVADMLSGGCIERAALTSVRCDELCAALREAVETSSALNLEGRNGHGDTPFLLACNAGHVANMGSLVAAGCDTAAKDNDGVDGLMNTALSGNPAAVRAALAAGWCELEAKNKQGKTAFLLACSKGRMKCMAMLVDAGCDTAAKSINGVNALMYAAGSGFPEAVRAALAAGW
jgi:ankyrin repeat protein